MMTTKTIQFYNENAESYFKSTATVDFTSTYNRFLKYIPEHGSIIDMGCGSGRDVSAFARMGYEAVGLDASEKLAEIAEKASGASVIIADMSSWVADEPFDGIWCCASILHLQNEELRSVFDNLEKNLKPGGVIFISVKSGIETGVDEKGRYMRNFTEKELEDLLKSANISVTEKWETKDKLAREDFYWINMIGIRDKT